MCYLRRSLAAQQRARQKEVMAQTKSMHTTMAIGRKALQVRALYCQAYLRGNKMCINHWKLIILSNFNAAE